MGVTHVAEAAVADAPQPVDERDGVIDETAKHLQHLVGVGEGQHVREGSQLVDAVQRYIAQQTMQRRGRAAQHEQCRVCVGCIGTVRRVRILAGEGGGMRVDADLAGHVGAAGCREHDVRRSLAAGGVDRGGIGAHRDVTGLGQVTARAVADHVGGGVEIDLAIGKHVEHGQCPGVAVSVIVLAVARVGSIRPGMDIEVGIALDRGAFQHDGSRRGGAAAGIPARRVHIRICHGHAAAARAGRVRGDLDAGAVDGQVPCAAMAGGDHLQAGLRVCRTMVVAAVRRTGCLEGQCRRITGVTHVDIACCMKAGGDLLAADGMDIGTAADVDVPGRLHLDASPRIFLRMVEAGDHLHAALGCADKLVGVHDAAQVDHALRDGRGHVGAQVDMAGA